MKAKQTLNKKVAILGIILFGCAPKGGNEIFGFGASQKRDPCNKEVYTERESFKDSFLPVIQKQFRIPEIGDGCVRLYYIPSFEKEMVLDICPGITLAYLPDTGTVWESMQILNKDEKGNILSGRVANVSDTIPRINIKTELVDEAIAKSGYRTLDSIDVWHMKSIQFRDCMMYDGTGIEVQEKKSDSTNYFRYSEASYKDTRYNIISTFLDSVYKGR